MAVTGYLQRCPSLDRLVLHNLRLLLRSDRPDNRGTVQCHNKPLGSKLLDNSRIVLPSLRTTCPFPVRSGKTYQARPDNFLPMDAGKFLLDNSNKRLIRSSSLHSKGSDNCHTLRPEVKLNDNQCFYFEQNDWIIAVKVTHRQEQQLRYSYKPQKSQF